MRVRGRITTILDAATAMRLRTGDNLRIGEECCKQACACAQKDAARVVDHPALPYVEIGAFMRDIAKQSGGAYCESGLVAVACQSRPLLRPMRVCISRQPWT